MSEEQYPIDKEKLAKYIQHKALLLKADKDFAKNRLLRAKYETVKELWDMVVAGHFDLKETSSGQTSS